MQVTLIKRPREPKGRQTILVDGRQVGYYREATGRIDFAPANVSDDLAALVREEVEALTSKPAVVATNPPPAPPEDAPENDSEVEG